MDLQKFIEEIEGSMRYQDRLFSIAERDGADKDEPEQLVRRAIAHALLCVLDAAKKAVSRDCESKELLKAAGVPKVRNR